MTSVEPNAEWLVVLVLGSLFCASAFAVWLIARADAQEALAECSPRSPAGAKAVVVPASTRRAARPPRAIAMACAVRPVGEHAVDIISLN